MHILAPLFPDGVNDIVDGVLVLWQQPIHEHSPGFMTPQSPQILAMYFGFIGPADTDDELGEIPKIEDVV